MSEWPTADEAMLDRVLNREGGFVNNPNDKGGPTNMGITLETLSEWLGVPATLGEIQQLSVEDAKKLYFHVYLERPGFEKIDDLAIRELLFDSAVQHGPGTAVKFLQQAIGAKPDGVFGPKTLQAYHESRLFLGAEDLFRHIFAQRIRYYGQIIAHNPSQAVFAAGWMNRLASLLETIYSHANGN